MKSAEVNQKKSGSNLYTVFTISDHLFALEISYIKEVLNFPAITLLPNKVAHFKGVFNLRGTIVTVIDIRYLLNLEIPANKNPEVVILAEYDDILIGIAVDQVMDIQQLEDIKIQIPSRKTPSAIAGNIVGYVDKEKLGNIYILDLIKLDRVLNP
jgi:purine-binding chemotaxis protein CheW